MKKYLLIAILFFSVNMFSQKPLELINSISVFKSIDTSFPKDSILFYFSGNKELSIYFEKLSKKLSKRINKLQPRNHHSFVIESNSILNVEISSFDDINITFSNPKYNSICVFYLGKNRITFEQKNSLDYDSFVPSAGNEENPYAIKVEKWIYYELFVAVVESKTSKIMFLKRFAIKFEESMNNSVNRLSKIIIKELKISKNINR